jgi:hypothetical protein
LGIGRLREPEREVGLRPNATSAVLSLCGFFLLWVPAARAVTGVRLVESGAERWVLEVSVPEPEVEEVPGSPWVRVALRGYGREGLPGHPDLPVRAVTLALPPTGTATVRVLEADPGPTFTGRPQPVPEERILPGDEMTPPETEMRYREDPVAYGGRSLVPAQLASLGEPAWWRHQRILPVLVHPVQWDPVSGTLRTYRRLLLEVRLVPSKRREDPQRPRIVAPGGSWERLYANRLVNYEQGRLWRRAPRRPLRAEKSLRDRPNGTMIRILVDRTDLYRVPFATLASAGMPGSSIPWDEVVLREYWYEEGDSLDPFRSRVVPIQPEDADGDGLFEEGEAFLFFGMDRWDRFRLSEGMRRFGRTHAYWVDWSGPDTSSVMSSESTWQGWEGLVPPDTVLLTQVVEKDSIYGRPAAAEDLDTAPHLGLASVRTSHYFWTPPYYTIPGDAYWAHFRLPVGSRLVGMVVELQGREVPSTVGRHRVSLSLRSGQTLWPFPQESYSTGLKARLRVELTEGDLAGFPEVYEPDSMALLVQVPEDGWGICLDRLTLSYRRPYRASQGRFRFHTGGLSGPQEIRVGGFDSAEILVFETTDSTRVRRLELGPGQVVPAEGGYEVRLQVDAGDGTRPRSFLLVERDRIPEIPEAWVKLRQVSAVPEEGDEDYVAIYYGDFLPALQPLLEHRASQGHRVLAVSIEDVYDQFNGGRPSPLAIRNLLRHLFRVRSQPPEFLLLVGDGSDDHAGVNPEADVNYVPTMTLPSTAFSSQGPELVANDEWFVDNLTGTGETLDFYPDMHIGRLPAGSLTELETMVSKIIRYENFQPDDAWRNRGVFLADDQYSSTISFEGSYDYKAYEIVFQRGTEQCIASVLEAAELTDFEVDSFFLARYLDTLRVTMRCQKDTSEVGGDPCDESLIDLPCWRDAQGEIARCASPPYELSQLQGGTPNSRGPLAEKLLASLSRGALFWSVESHANARLISHEYVFANIPVLRQDVPEIQNLDSPFIFMGFGCHLCEFSDYREKRAALKDCIGERLLYHGSATQSFGAVGSVGSTGYEWVSANDVLHTALFEALYEDPPRPLGQTRWIFGEIFTLGKFILMERNPQNENYQGQVLTYTYLGDPALRVDMAPPRLHVRVNGEDVTSGSEIAAADPSDSVEVEVRVLDEVAVGSLVVKDGSRVLPEEAVEILPDTTRPGDDRVYLARFRLGLRPETYAVVLEVPDALGRLRSFPLNVTLRADFFLSVGGEFVPLEPGQFVPPGGRIVIRLASPVFLDASAFTVLVGDQPVAFSAEPDSGGTPTRFWRIETDPLEFFDETTHDLTLEIRHHNLEEPTAVGIVFASSPAGGKLRIVRLFNIPNPFTEETWFHYVLNDEASRARIRIYTLRGRLLRVLDELPAHVNENVVAWDGRDEEGDQIANGVYFYRLEVWDTEGRKVSRLERLVRAR